MHRQHFEYRTAIAYDNGTFAGLSHRRKARNAVPTDGGSKGHAAEEGEKAPPSTISADKCGTCTVLRSLLQEGPLCRARHLRTPERLCLPRPLKEATCKGRKDGMNARDNACTRKLKTQDICCTYEICVNNLRHTKKGVYLTRCNSSSHFNPLTAAHR